ncbi:GFA family protein [Qipengyuania soli]|uniref:GFA family protein n=1 Tax=Qipengyuania soli TaxID=2782568 RepID=A0A7S8F2Y7_9SPHN|nr:GFA family protein [Qipengyuania soli]QPC99530.1 GFA family protein [Qipengyuania soli]
MREEGGCHCGAVRFAIEIDPPVELLICNCSICSMTGFRHLIVKGEDFTLLSGGDALTSYKFGTGKADHLFCSTCGIKSFYRPRSHPDGWSVNFNCLDRPGQIAVNEVPFDGRNWEAAKAALDAEK